MAHFTSDLTPSNNNNNNNNNNKSLFHKINTHILCYKNYEGKKQATYSSDIQQATYSSLYCISQEFEFGTFSWVTVIKDVNTGDNNHKNNNFDTE